MPIMLHRHGRAELSNLQERITRMTLAELVAYEADLWKWMQALDSRRIRGKAFIPRRHSDNIVYQINAIHREVEWRAGQKDWDNAAHSQQRPRTVGQGTN